MAAMTTQPTSVPPPELQLHLLVGDKEDFFETNGAGSRRPFTASLTRFWSCPQLATLTNTSQDSPSSDMAPITDKEGNIIHTCPTTRNSLHVDEPGSACGDIRSATSTPTPPSTPASSRKSQIVSEYNFESHKHDEDFSHIFTSKLARQSITNNTFAKTSRSLDNQEGKLKGWTSPEIESNQNLEHQLVRDDSSLLDVPFNDAHEKTLDGDRVNYMDAGSSMHIKDSLHGQSNRLRYQNSAFGDSGDNSADKCSRWLQSLILNKRYKIKARSHIQLPSV